MEPNKGEDKSIEIAYNQSSERLYHGTKANLKQGDLIEPGFNSNYGKRKIASYVYLTATLDAAIWGAELALGEDSERIYKNLKTVHKENKKVNLLEFSPKEIEILHHFCTELSYKEIGSKLGVSSRTVESYRDALFEKTGINTRIGLVVYAIKNGVVSL